ncbi:MAG: excisionase family DNA-binding protein [Trueperaceae bacterium]
MGTGKELSTREAANLLNVSRQYFSRMLNEDRIPSHNVGSHRRVYVRDVLDFKAKRDAKRRRQLDELTQLTEEFGGYDAERR